MYLSSLSTSYNIEMQQPVMVMHYEYFYLQSYVVDNSCSCTMEHNLFIV